MACSVACPCMDSCVLRRLISFVVSTPPSRIRRRFSFSSHDAEVRPDSRLCCRDRYSQQYYSGIKWIFGWRIGYYSTWISCSNFIERLIISVQVKSSAIFRKENTVVFTARQCIFCIQSDSSITTGYVDIIECFQLQEWQDPHLFSGWCSGFFGHLMCHHQFCEGCLYYHTGYSTQRCCRFLYQHRHL